MTSVEYFLMRQVMLSEDHPQGWDKYVYDDESVHYGILHILLEDSPEFARSLLDLKSTPKSVKVILTPDNGIFDLLVIADGRPHYLEIKIWANLTENQFNRQLKYINGKKAKGHYILFTKAADQWQPEEILTRSKGTCRVIGNDELLTLADSVGRNAKRETTEIANAYKAVLRDIQRRW